MTWTTLPRSDLTPDLSGWLGGDGDGRNSPLILIHGVGLRAESWSAMLPDLTRHFSVIVPDLPGHGSSPNLSLNATNLPDLNDYTSKLAQLLKGLPEKALVAGHSLGALIALDLAAKHPDQLAGVVPLNAIYRRTKAAADAVKARAAELNSSARSDPSPTVSRWFGDDPTGGEADMAEQCHNWLNQVDPLGYRRAYHVFAHQDGPSDSQLENLALPALFITGSDEPNSTPAMSEAMAQRAPLGRAVVIDGARHMMPMTHAAQVSQYIIAFHQNLGAQDA